MSTQIVSNMRWRHVLERAAILLGMTSLLAVIGGLIGGLSGLAWALLVSLAIGLAAPTVSARRFLRRQGAIELSQPQAPRLVAMVRDLSRRAGLAKSPRLFLSPAPGINAFALGVDGDASIGLTRGLLTQLSDRQLRGVLAHEIAHISSGDTRLLSFANALRRVTHGASFAGVFLLPFSAPVWGIPLAVPVLLFAAPLLSLVLWFALSRSREFAADLQAVRYTEDPVGLAEALQLIDRVQGGWLRRWVAAIDLRHLEWLQTHPQTQARVERLLAVGATVGPAKAELRSNEELYAPRVEVIPPTGRRQHSGTRRQEAGDSVDLETLLAWVLSSLVSPPTRERTRRHDF